MGVTHLDKAFNQQQYQENIRKLRSGTALESTEFVQLMRQRALHDFGIAEAYIVDTTLFEKDEILRNKNPKDKKTPYSKYLTSKLDDDTLNQHYQKFSDEKADIDMDANPLFMRKTLKELSRDDKGNFQHQVLKYVERENPTAVFFKHDDKAQTAIIPQVKSSTVQESIAERTGWNENDFKLVHNNDEIDDLHTCDHEIGHALLNKHLQGSGSLNDYESSDYALYIHECVADAIATLSAIHEGGGKECFDTLTLERAYGGLIHNDTVHFTNATIQHLKENTLLENIQALPDKKAVAEYAIRHVLGDREKDIKPSILSLKAYNQQTEIVQNLHNLVQDGIIEKGQPSPTPLQLDTMVQEGLFDETEAAFLRRYFTHHKDTLVHKHDVMLELDTQERFDNPEIPYDADPFYDLAYEENVSEFEAEIQDTVFPISDDDELMTIAPEERLYRLNKQIRSYKQEHTPEMEAVFAKYKEHLQAKIEENELRDEIEPHERSNRYEGPDILNALEESEETPDYAYHIER